MVEVTGSTQDDLAALVARNEAKNGEVLVSEFQSAGRGRLDRTFEAPQSSALLFSLYLEPKRAKSEWSFLPLLAGLVSTLAISELDPEIYSRTQVAQMIYRFQGRNSAGLLSKRQIAG